MTAADQIPPEPGQVVTVFRNRLRPEADPAYSEELGVMAALAREMPGFIESKTFTAPDGERVTIVRFADEQAQRAWREHAGHRRAQRNGIEHYYSTYSISVAVTTYASHFVSPGDEHRRPSAPGS